MIVQAGFNKAGIVNKKYYSPWMATAARSEKGYKTKYLFSETTIGASGWRCSVCVHERNTPAAAASAAQWEYISLSSSQPVSQLFICRRSFCQKKHCGAPQWARDRKREEIKPSTALVEKIMGTEWIFWSDSKSKDEKP
jgi:hypothetical protein